MLSRLFIATVVLSLLLTGCVGLGSESPAPTDTPTSLPPSTPEQTPTQSTPTPTSTPSPQPTETTPTPEIAPTPELTPSPTPEPTPSPTPTQTSARIGEWATTTHNGTEIRFQVVSYEVKDSIEESDGDTETPADGHRYLVAEVWVSSSPGDKIRTGREQWTYIDIQGTEYSPDEIMDEIDPGETYPEEVVLHNDQARGKIIWEVPYWRDLTFEVEPYDDQPGGTVQIVND